MEALKMTCDYQVGKSIPFERIRRITGYLVGDMKRWNDAKAAEEKNRVTHQAVKAE